MRRRSGHMVIQRLHSGVFVAWAAALTALAPAQAERPLGPEELFPLVEERMAALVPKIGRVVASYRVRGQPEDKAVIVWDSAEPDRYASKDLPRVPAWLPLVVTLRLEDLRDGYGALYTGPLFAHVSGAGEIIGPYPEGFICAIDGACSLSAIPTFEPYSEGRVGLHIYYRGGPVFIEVDGRPWPEDPDYYIDWKRPEVGLTGRTFHFGGYSIPEKGFQSSPVRSEVIGDQRVLTTGASFAMAGKRPAHDLPIRFEWRLEDAEGQPLEKIENETATDAEGRTTDKIAVPATVTSGYVRIWHHQYGPDYSPATTLEFDFAEKAEE